jgi:AcrR family transcriptional regulator
MGSMSAGPAAHRLHDHRQARSNGAYHHGDLREHAILVACRMLAENGDAPPSMRQLAENLGVSVTALYRHFDSRRALIDAIRADGHRQLSTFLFAKASERDSSDGQSIPKAQAYIAFAIKHPGLFRLMSQCAGRPERAPQTEGDCPSTATIVKSWPFCWFPANLDHIRFWSVVHGFALLLINGHIDPVSEEKAAALLASVIARAPAKEMQ